MEHTIACRAYHCIKSVCLYLYVCARAHVNERERESVYVSERERGEIEHFCLGFTHVKEIVCVSVESE